MSEQDTSNREPSGLAWLGELPRGWRAEPFRRIFRESSEVNGPSPIGVMLSVSGYRGVEPKAYEFESQRRDDEEVQFYRVVRPGQLAVNTMWLNYAGLGVSQHLGHVSPAYRAYWIRPDMNKRYLHHLLRSSVYVDAYTAMLTGIRPNSLQMSRQDLMSFPVLVPPAEQQEAIADYLDSETAEIDAFIADQEQLIELMSERRASLVLDVITEVAARRTALRNAYSVVDCKHVTVPEGEEGIPLVSVRQLDGEEVDLSRARRTDRSSYMQLIEGGRDLRPGDLVVCRNASVGKSSRVPDPAPEMAMGQDVSRIRPRGSNSSEYLQWVLMSPIGVDAFERAMIGSTFRRINVDDIKGMRIPIPSPVDQYALVEQLRRAASSTNAAIDDARVTIALSRERRAALISAAVTGQIDVTERKRALV